MDNANQDVEVPCGNSLKRKIELSQHTKSTMVEVNFTWKIDKFSFKARVMKNFESLKSKFFSADGDKKAQAHPAKFMFTYVAFHVITTTVLFYNNLAIGARLIAIKIISKLI